VPDQLNSLLSFVVRLVGLEALGLFG